ncbi:zinc-binding dehydrogenase [Actinomadura rugatobispora]|uniref:Zinc-binding dehydrogenase n=1 Tax=Actinomadura rugatobispora TaxID=1994 RepID=A0ABW1AC14_9ACTN|nr:zinc-binding dehydrogenase [Actinomadura rugatobispora]
MIAAFTTSGGVGVGEVPEPVPGEGQVLVAPLAAGICGSDLHLVDAITARGEAAPRIVLGHEFCAEILEPGPGTSGRFEPGTRVVSVPHVFGPSGPVDLGFSPVLPGGFAPRAVMQESLLLRVPDGLEDERAALTEPLAVAVHAVRAARPAHGDVALVIGCGPIGLAVIAVLKAEGHGPVVATDFSPARRAVAERLGADVVLNPADSSPYEAWDELGVTERPPSPLLDGELPAGNVMAFECVGGHGLLQQLIDGLPRHSRIVVVGSGVTPETITPVAGILKEVSLTFVFAYRQAEFAHALGLLAGGRVDAGAFVTGVVGLDGVPGAFDDLRAADEHVKIIVRPR